MKIVHFLNESGIVSVGIIKNIDMIEVVSRNKDDELTDSKKMFKLGLEGVKPKDETHGVQPEWFYI